MKNLIFAGIFLLSTNLFAAGMPEVSKVSQLIQQSRILNGDEFQNMELVSKKKTRKQVNKNLSQVRVERTYEVESKYCNLGVTVNTYYMTWNKAFIKGTTKIKGEITDVGCVSQPPKHP